MSKFAVKTSFDKHESDSVQLSITNNGYQWTTIRIPKAHIPDVIKALLKESEDE